MSPELQGHETPSTACPRCEEGTMRVETTRVQEKIGTRTQYCICSICRYRFKRIVPIRNAPVRKGMVESWAERRELCLPELPTD
ncbi:hypothetical protein [Neorhodopirellula pilleata]|uniref:Uncharacterized protein n=1 Tax=Neorhodopirellula pilleata TaxID=2714738 RepID=A0A5C5YU97_9BACT|nr:hypothetical protein [Neorhodopirellula pilleata]TWT78602.1 hypothetical protein Pla100_62940 [Neorhodopirellula pilleata]